MTAERFGPIVVCFGRDQGWFRIFDRGLHWKNARRAPLRFSERNGYKKPTVRIGSWWFTVLRAGRLR